MYAIRSYYGINQQLLERILRAEFRENGIDLNFKYAVKTYPHGEEKFVFGDPDYKPDNRKEYRDVLFPRDIPEPKPRITSYNVCYTKLLRRIF